MTTTEQFIADNAKADVRPLALRKAPEGVDLRWALQQIEGRQLAARKLPTWAATEGIHYPPRISLEQCSSEATAAYKRALAGRLTGGNLATFIDLTAGFGADFAAIATLAECSTYVEQSAHLCELARHNMPLLGLGKAAVRQAQAEHVLQEDWHADILMIDPARRDTAGRKTVLIEDCTPDVCALQASLRSHASYTIVKLSPMLDIKAAMRALNGIKEVHVVGAAGECKELLIVLRGNSPAGATSAGSALPTDKIPIFCADGQPFTFSTFQFDLSSETAAPLRIAGSLGSYIYEPSATVLKAGAYRTLCQRFTSLAKLAPSTHLYTSDTLLTDFPGRTWHLADSSTFAKHDLRRLLSGTRTAELSTRGFPMSVAALRRQLHLSEGGGPHFMATTLADGTRRLLKIEPLEGSRLHDTACSA